MDAMATINFKSGEARRRLFEGGVYYVYTVVSRKRAHGQYTLLCAQTGVGGYL